MSGQDCWKVERRRPDGAVSSRSYFPTESMAQEAAEQYRVCCPDVRVEHLDVWPRVEPKPTEFETLRAQLEEWQAKAIKAAADAEEDRARLDWVEDLIDNDHVMIDGYGNAESSGHVTIQLGPNTFRGETLRDAIDAGRNIREAIDAARGGEQEKQ